MDTVKLQKLSDKVLAKFARRSVTMRQVLVAIDSECASAVDAAIAEVKEELARRNVKWKDGE